MVKSSIAGNSTIEFIDCDITISKTLTILFCQELSQVKT